MHFPGKKTSVANTGPLWLSGPTPMYLLTPPLIVPEHWESDFSIHDQLKLNLVYETH